MGDAAEGGSGDGHVGAEDSLQRVRLRWKAQSKQDSEKLHGGMRRNGDKVIQLGSKGDLIELQCQGGDAARRMAECTKSG